MRYVLGGFVTVVFFALCGASFSAFADDDSDLVCAEKVEMGTPFKICVVASPEQKLDATFDLGRAFKEIGKINQWMSDWLPSSELSKVNQASGARPVVVSKDLLHVVQETLAISKASDGAMDPTFNALWGTYNFKKGQERRATDEELKERLPLINWKNVVVDEAASTLFLKQPGMKLGLGAVGQGYAVDRAVALLKARGYEGGYADGSGDTLFWGTKSDGKLWTTAVRDPRDPSKIITRFYGTDVAITTCGDDEKFFMEGGERVHHVIDPKTGRSANRSRQVTVIARRAFDADAWDTAAFVMGPVAAAPVLEKLGMQAVMVSGDGKVTFTKGLQKSKGEWGEGYLVRP